MKELSIEEKAKAYDDAIKKAESLYKAAEPMSGCNVIIETLFPELAESEDESIRKELLEHCKNQAKPYIQTGNKCPQIQSWIAWLEKQGEITKEWPEMKKANIRTELQEMVELKQVSAYLAWSEEDEKIIQNLLSLWEEVMIEPTCCRFGLHKDEIVEWFKSLKDRVLPKQEWSEEDENVISLILSICNDFLESFKISPASTRVVKEDVDKIENWLKSLRPQNRWKPSEEMLKALYRAIPENTMAISEDEMLLDKLYQGLKYGRVLSNK